MMKFISVLILTALMWIGCSKPIVQPEVPKSKITVKKDSIAWEHEGVVANYNAQDDMFHVMTGKDNETFIISFKKSSIPFDGVIKDYSTSVMVAPFKGSAAISAIYLLDTTKLNKLRLLVIDNPEKRVACDFVLHLKKDSQNTDPEEAHVFQGRFDVRY